MRVFLVPISQDLGFDRTGVSLVMALFMAVQGLLAPLVGLNIDRLGPRRVVITGLGILALTTLALARATSATHLYLAFGDHRPESEFGAGKGPAAGQKWSIGEALARPNFRRLAASYFGCGFTMSMVQTHFPAHALHGGMTNLEAATAFGR